MHKYKLITAYDGTEFGGWQVQPNSVTIQELIQNALATVVRQKVDVTGSGRTDAGVHARGQTAHFAIDTQIDPYRVRGSLNGLLPTSIRILRIEEIESGFHARYSALNKTYHYHLHLEPYIDPFKRLYSAHIRHKIDIPLMKEAARLFLGTHDFTSFANEAHRGSAAKKPVKTMMRLDVCEEPGGLRLELKADGFLYKMVRNIVGTLIEIASHKRPAEDIPLLFAAKDRRQADTAAPSCGLFLHSVQY